MILSDLEKNWNELGKQDPYWAILTDNSKRNNKWNIDEFYKTGQDTFDSYWIKIKNLGVELETNYALDFGCGVGRITQAICCYFDRVVGVDIAVSMIELAQKNNKFKNKCDYIRIKEDNLNIFQDETFDFIISLLTLQHMKPECMERYMSEFIRILKPDGLIIFNHPSEVEGILNKIFEFSIRYISSIVNKCFHKPIMQMHGINKEKVEQFINNNGGKVIFIEKNRMLNWISYTYYIINGKKYLEED